MSNALSAALQFTDAPGNEIALSEFVPAGHAIEIDYPEGASTDAGPVCRVTGPAAVPPLALGDWLVRDAAGALSVVPERDFPAQYEAIEGS